MIRILQLHKRSSYTFEYIQDKVAVGPNCEVFALADGTTQSFKSEVWADILTQEFVANSTFEVNKLIENFTAAVGKYKSTNVTFSSNPAKASLEKAKQIKGGTATFVGLRLQDYEQLEAISCGDSNLFVLDKKGIQGIPFESVEQLDRNNHFINTEELLKREIDHSFFEYRKIKLEKDHRIIIASDALSRLILEKPEVVKELLEIQDFNALHDFCRSYWDDKMLQEDDVSAIIIEGVSDGKNQKPIFIQPSKDFSFPPEKQEEFVPTSLHNPIHPKFSAMEMNELREQFNGIAHDFYKVKQKLWLQQILLFVAIGLLLLNLTAFYFLLLRSDEQSDNSFSEPPETETSTLNNYQSLAPIVGYIEESLITLQKTMEDVKENTDSLWTNSTQKSGGESVTEEIQETGQE